MGRIETCVSDLNPDTVEVETVVTLAVLSIAAESESRNLHATISGALQRLLEQGVQVDWNTVGAEVGHQFMEGNLDWDDGAWRTTESGCQELEDLTTGA
jgi:hypothetical protein